MFFMVLVMLLVLFVIVEVVVFNTLFVQYSRRNLQPPQVALLNVGRARVEIRTRDRGSKAVDVNQ